MIVEHFLKWIDTARVAERAAAANALARAYIASDLSFEDRCAAEAALTLLLDDPSPKVRLALAEPLSFSPHAPAQIVSVLAADQPEIAALVLARSPVLTDGDLIDGVAGGSESTQKLVATRPLVSMQVAAAIAEVGEASACLALVCNEGAEIASLSFRRMAERHGSDPALRAALLSDPRLPADTRHMLLVKLGEALKTSPLVLALIGAARAERVTRDACTKASLTLIESTARDEYEALVEHLRLNGEITTSFVIRTIAHGKIDFFGAILVSLAGQDESRVRALLADGRDVALTALFRTAGLPANAHGVILKALKIWREVAHGKRVTGAQEVSWLMLKDLNAASNQSGPKEADRDLAALLKSIHLDALRDNARGHALAIAAAA